MSSDEDGMLAFTAQTREAGSRLSCQITLTPELDGLQVTLPASQY
jgi:2Fe-2S ferredoxin